MKNVVEVHEAGDWQQVWFYCPGCKCSHAYTTKNPEPTGPQWSWNGSLTKPTFSPSLLCNKDHPESRCHLFINDGMIQFLGDCHHDLKNRTVPVPEVD